MLVKVASFRCQSRCYDSAPVVVVSRCYDSAPVVAVLVVVSRCYDSAPVSVSTCSVCASASWEGVGEWVGGWVGGQQNVCYALDVLHACDM